MRISNQPDDVNSHLVILSGECNPQEICKKICCERLGKYGKVANGVLLLV